LSTEELETAVTAMAEISKGYGETRWQTGQDQMHNEIDQVLTELDERRNG
jgi:hypothetical protein